MLVPKQRKYHYQYSRITSKLDWVFQIMTGECHVEVLMNVSEESIENLIDTYRKFNEIPYASSALVFAKTMKNETNYPVRFLCLDDGLKEDGTIFMLSEVNIVSQGNSHFICDRRSVVINFA